MKPGEGASTVIGKSICIRGELSGKEDLYMDGTIEGTITLPENRLTIGPNARFLADVVARDVIVQGSMNGNIKASGKVELRQTSQVAGDIVSVRLSMEESAVMSGRIELMTPAALHAEEAAGNLPQPERGAQLQMQEEGPAPLFTAANPG
jgi:cytoskeletal protein CcmA (bactofilin family)